MGGIRKEAKLRGKTLESSFAQLQEYDRDEHGSDYYSGGWNNAQGVVEVSEKKFNSGEPSKHEPVLGIVY